jgi:hypothetical protein
MCYTVKHIVKAQWHAKKGVVNDSNPETMQSMKTAAVRVHSHFLSYLLVLAEEICKTSPPIFSKGQTADSAAIFVG